MSAAQKLPNRYGPPCPKRARLRPERQDADDVGHRVLAHFGAFHPAADVHRQLAAQREVAGMHFRHHRPGHGARIVRLGPETVAPHLVGQVFDDGDAVPHHGVAVPQHRHLAVRRGDLADGLLLLVPVVAIDGNLEFLERQAGLLARQPAAQRPARIVLVADDKLHGERLTIHVDRVEAERRPSRTGSGSAGRCVRVPRRPARRRAVPRCRSCIRTR